MLTQYDGQNKRLFWADALRSLAIFCVVIIHVSAPYVSDVSNVLSFDWQVANVFNSLSRIAVPFFVMLSGAFLLAKKESISHFIQKRIPRILIPWAVWGGIQILFEHRFSLQKIVSGDLLNTLHSTYFGGFWFMPLILALYLITPIIKPFVQRATKKDFFYFFSIWGIFAVVLPSLFAIWEVGIPVELPLFVRYLGYFVAGYYIVHKTNYSQEIIRQITILSIISGIVLLLANTALNQTVRIFFEPVTEESYVFVVLLSLSVFVALKNVFVKYKLNNKVKRIMYTISQASFGIFLSHALFLNMLQPLASGTAPFVEITVLSVLTFIISFGVIHGLRKITPKLFG